MSVDDHLNEYFFCENLNKRRECGEVFMGFPDLLLNFALHPVNEFNHVYVDARVISTAIAATK